MLKICQELFDTVSVIRYQLVLSANVAIKSVNLNFLLKQQKYSSAALTVPFLYVTFCVWYANYAVMNSSLANITPINRFAAARNVRRRGSCRTRRNGASAIRIILNASAKNRLGKRSAGVIIASGKSRTRISSRTTIKITKSSAGNICAATCAATVVNR